MPPQVVALADTVKGELTVAPLEGVATAMFDEVEPDVTVIFSETTPFVFFPQHFTWSTCDPGVAVT